MGVASAVLCAEELEGELQTEMARARGERLVLRSLDGAKIEARLEEKREFEMRAGALQRRLRELVRAAAREKNIPADREDVAVILAERDPQAARLNGLIDTIRHLAKELARVNAINLRLAERALSVTKAYVRVLAPKPSAYDRRGAESSHLSALGSVSRRA